MNFLLTLEFTLIRICGFINGVKGVAARLNLAQGKRTVLV